MNGIYCYIDNKDSSVVYVGKDSNIERSKRRKDHISKSNYNHQPFNRILQNNPKRYRYKVLKKGNFSDNLLNALEILYIQRYKTFRPKTNQGFNFSIGMFHDFYTCELLNNIIKEECLSISNP